jgi:hypothetical protein
MSVDDIRVWEAGAGPVPAHGVVPSGAPVAGDGRVHARDVHGGTRAELAPGWASRLKGAYPPTFDPPDGRRGPPGTRRLTDTGGHERTFDGRPATGAPLLDWASSSSARTGGDKADSGRPKRWSETYRPAQTRSGDLRHLRGHRADTAARDRPGDLGDAHRAAHVVETRTRARRVASSWGAGASRDDVRLGFRLGSDGSLAGDEERFGEVAWS